MPPKKKKENIVKRCVARVRSIPGRSWEIVIGSVCVFSAVFSSFVIFNIAGKVGNTVRAYLFIPAGSADSSEVAVFGWSFVLLIIFLYFFGVFLLLHIRPISYLRLFAGGALGFFSGAVFFAASFDSAAGGVVGNSLFNFLQDYLALFSFVLIPLGILGSLYILKLFSPRAIIDWLTDRGDETEDGEEEYEEVEEEEEYDEAEDEEEYEEEYDETEDGEEEEYEEEYEEEEKDDKAEKKKKDTKTKSAQAFSKYMAPPLNLLSIERGKGRASNTKMHGQVIARTLKNFRIDIEVEEVTVGPTFTRYAVRPAEGVRLSKITGLQQNLELALAAHPIRIEAPIPGESLVGIEVPNSSRAVVGLRTLLESKGFQSAKGVLPLAIGKTIDGTVFAKSLSKMPHALVAGTTGSGKSVLIHNFILSLLFSYGPHDLRFIFIDPKRVELTLYKGIPHLYTPPITDPKKALQALAWTVAEMERRYELLEEAGARDIGSYNSEVKEGKEHLPFLVVVVDELADLMQNFPREIESNIVRITQKSRAVGIHLIISTQRPSVNIITGVVKANVPVRVALQVASGIDSRTILDSVGAENLIGAGDMLYASAETKKPVRVQSAFIDENEVKGVVDYIVKKNGVAEGVIDVTQKVKGGGSGGAIADGDEEEEELYTDAREIVIQSKKASTSLLQRKLKIGYSRAARLIDLLEKDGVVGPQVGSKPREILVEDDDTYNADEEEDA